jgi:hypothetical protein
MQGFKDSLVGIQTVFLIRSLGYCLLFFFLLDFVFLIIPPKFTDPAWELNLYGQIIERVPILLFSFPLIFFGEYNYRRRLEKIATKVISWMAIVMAIFFILGLPLTVANTYRLQSFRQDELVFNVGKQTAPAEQFFDRLKKAESDTEIRSILKTLNPQQQISDKDIPDPQVVKKNLLDQIAGSVSESKSQVEMTKRQISIGLWKNSIKWLFAGILSAAFLLYIWRQSKWARMSGGWDFG